MTVVDAGILIGHLRGTRKATVALKEAIARGETLVPAIAAWETWCGATTPARRTAIETTLDVLRVDPMTAAISERAADLYIRLARKGRPVGDADTMIAAHALYHDAPLLTLDGHYDGIEGLRVLKVA